MENLKIYCVIGIGNISYITAVHIKPDGALLHLLITDLLITYEK